MRTQRQEGVLARSLGELGLLGAVSFCWAWSYLLIKLAVAEIPPTTLAAARLVIAAIVLAFWLRISSAPLPRDRRMWCRFALIAFLGQAAPFFLISWAETRVPAGETSALIAATPIFALLLSPRVGASRFDRRAWTGVALGLAGLVGSLWSGSSATSAQEWLPRGALVLAALGYAGAGCITAQLPPGRSSVMGTAVTGCAALFLLPFSLFADQPWQLEPSPRALAAVIVLGVVSTAAAYVAYYRLIGLSGPAFAGTHHYLVPVLGMALGNMVSGEELGSHQILAAALVVLGIFLCCKRAPTTSRAEQCGF